MIQVKLDILEALFGKCESILLLEKTENGKKRIQVMLVNGGEAKEVQFEQLLIALEVKIEQLENIFSSGKISSPVGESADSNSLILSSQADFGELAKLLKKRIEVWTEDSKGIRNFCFKVLPI